MHLQQNEASHVAFTFSPTHLIMWRHNTLFIAVNQCSLRYHTQVPPILHMTSRVRFSIWVWLLLLWIKILLTGITEWYLILKRLWEEFSVGFSVPVEARRYFRRKSQPCNSYLTWKLSVILRWRGINLKFKYLILELYKFSKLHLFNSPSPNKRLHIGINTPHQNNIFYYPSTPTSYLSFIRSKLVRIYFIYSPTIVRR